MMDSRQLQHGLSRFGARRRGLFLVLCLGILLSACGSPSSSGPPKVKIAYIGLTCEAPLFVAYENGFFKEEGVDAEMVKVDWSTMREGLGSGQCDATHTLITYVLKPVEQGLDVRMTGGVHKGCLKMQAAKGSAIQTLSDFKGKRIGVQNMGSPPYLFSCRVLADHGIDPKEIDWRVYPASEMELALDKGEIDGVANSEPVGSLLLAHEKVRTIVDQSLDAPYKDEFCCVTVVSGKFASRDPAGAAKVTRAILKGAKWVSANPSAAAKIAVDKKWIASSYELNALALSKLKYEPSVSDAKNSVLLVARALKSEKLLNAGTDPEDLARRAFLPLDGVTDDWVNSLKVETIAGGGKYMPIDPAAITLSNLATCCSKNIQ
ncbi:MAG TPA: ABC transporter substrate-binding protein [Phycisphaerae bacterium]